VRANGGRRCRVHRCIQRRVVWKRPAVRRLNCSTSKSPARSRPQSPLARPSCTCGRHLQVSKSAFIVNGIPFTRAIFNRYEQRVPPGLRITSTIPDERRLGQEVAHSRIDGTEVGGVEVYTTTCMVRLAHAPRQRGEIVGHVTFSLELGLNAKHFGMRAGQARSSRNSILYTEKTDLLAVYERSQV
jgi:hypothetical protein